MDLNTFQTICSVIVLLGSVVVAIKTIFEWLGKPIRLYKQKQEESVESKAEKVLQEKIPAILAQHDEELRKSLVDQISCEVIKKISSEMDVVNKLEERYEALEISAKDVLREKIMAIYHKNKNTRTLTYHEKEALDQYYKDYKKLKGNSYIDRYYNRMLHWRIVDDDYDDEI